MQTPYRGLTLTTAPAQEPVSVESVNLMLGLSSADDNALVSSLVLAARQACERYTGRSLITQTWTMYLDRLPGDR